MKQMTYDEICASVLEAMEKFEKMNCTPRTIWLSPATYNILAKHAPNRPTFMGLDVMIGEFPPGMRFYIEQEGERE